MCFTEGSKIVSGYFVRPRRPHNQETGMGTNGAWTGMYYKEAIDGKTRSWDGNHRQTLSKEHI